MKIIIFLLFLFLFYLIFSFHLIGNINVGLACEDECIWMLWFTENWETYFKWVIIGRERTPLSGKIHWQCAGVLHKQTAEKTILSWPCFKGAHVASMAGTPLQNRVYCTKDGDYTEFGTCPGQPKGGAPKGSKNATSKPLDYAIEQLRNGKTFAEIAQSGELGARAIVRHGRGLKELAAYLPAQNTMRPDLCVIWVHGPTGIGKSQRTWDLGTSLYGLHNIWTSPDPTLQWFNDYNGQPYAIFDDFRSKGVSINTLLRVTDIYPISVPTKGGFEKFKPRVIVFTSPHSVDDTFAKRKEHIPEDMEQVHRRITFEIDATNETINSEWKMWKEMEKELFETLNNV